MSPPDEWYIEDSPLVLGLTFISQSQVDISSLFVRFEGISPDFGRELSEWFCCIYRIFSCICTSVRLLSNAREVYLYQVSMVDWEWQGNQTTVKLTGVNTWVCELFFFFHFSVNWQRPTGSAFKKRRGWCLVLGAGLFTPRSFHTHISVVVSHPIYCSNQLSYCSNIIIIISGKFTKIVYVCIKAYIQNITPESEIFVYRHEIVSHGTPGLLRFIIKLVYAIIVLIFSCETRAERSHMEYELLLLWYILMWDAGRA